MELLRITVERITAVMMPLPVMVPEVRKAEVRVAEVKGLEVKEVEAKVSEAKEAGVKEVEVKVVRITARTMNRKRISLPPLGHRRSQLQNLLLLLPSLLHLNQLPRLLLLLLKLLLRHRKHLRLSQLPNLRPPLASLAPSRQEPSLSQVVSLVVLRLHTRVLAQVLRSHLVVAAKLLPSLPLVLANQRLSLLPPVATSQPPSRLAPVAASQPRHPLVRASQQGASQPQVPSHHPSREETCLPTMPVVSLALRVETVARGVHRLAVIKVLEQRLEAKVLALVLEQRLVDKVLVLEERPVDKVQVLEQRLVAKVPELEEGLVDKVLVLEVRLVAKVPELEEGLVAKVLALEVARACPAIPQAEAQSPRGDRPVGSLPLVAKLAASLGDGVEQLLSVSQVLAARAMMMSCLAMDGANPEASMSKKGVWKKYFVQGTEETPRTKTTYLPHHVVEGGGEDKDD